MALRSRFSPGDGSPTSMRRRTACHRTPRSPPCIRARHVAVGDRPVSRIGGWDRPAERARVAFASLVGTVQERVTLLPQVSVGMGIVAGEPGTRGRDRRPGRRVHLGPVPAPGRQGARCDGPRGPPARRRRQHPADDHARRVQPRPDADRSHGGMARHPRPGRGRRRAGDRGRDAGHPVRRRRPAPRADRPLAAEWLQARPVPAGHRVPGARAGRWLTPQPDRRELACRRRSYGRYSAAR